MTSYVSCRASVENNTFTRVCRLCTASCDLINTLRACTFALCTIKANYLLIYSHQIWYTDGREVPCVTVSVTLGPKG